MSPRKIGILVIVFAALFAAVFFLSRPPGIEAPDGVQAGDRVFPDLDLNAVQTVTITGPDGTGTLARKEGTWVVAGLHDYPADFAELRQRLRALGDLKVGQVAEGGDDMLDEYGLGSNAALVTLTAEDGSELAAFTIGESREGQRPGPYGGGYPDGQYIRSGAGPVLLVAQTVGPFPAEGSGWIKKQLLEVPSADVQHVAVFSTNGTYGIDFSDGHAMQGLAEDEEINTSEADRLRRALQYLSCVTVAGPADLVGLGFDDPATFIAKAQDGIAYTVVLGNRSDDGRHVRFSTKFSEPPEVTRADAEAVAPEPAEGAEKTRDELIEETLTELKADREETIEQVRKKLEELADLEKWTFVISTYNADSMELGRDQVVKKVEPPEPETEGGDEGGGESLPSS